MKRWLFAFSVASVLAACGGDDTEDPLPPQLVDDEATTAEDTAVVIDVLANDSDPDGDILRLLTASAAGHEAIVEDGRVRFTPATNFHGNVEIEYRVNDGASTVSGRARVTVAPVNDRPVARATTVATGRNLAVAVRLAGDDVDGDALTFEVASNPTNGTLTGTAPDLTYTPANNVTGTDTFTFRARDASASSEPATITINVVAGAPPVAQAQSVTTAEDTAATVTLAATDADGDTLTYAIAQPPMHGTLSGAAPQVTYTPAADYHGPDSFQFTASDGLLTSPAATVAIAVTASSDAPVATAQTVAGAEDTPSALVLAGSDVDGDALTFAIVEAPARGTLSGTGADRTYTPAADLNGPDSFTFTVSDGQTTSAPATVTINVAAIEDIPVAGAQSVAASEDTARAITLAGSDGDGDALTFTVTSGPAHGTLSGTAPELTYTPAANYNGADAISFTVNDGDHDSFVTTIPITVAAVDDPPVLAGAMLTIPEDGMAAIPLPATDVDGETLTFQFWNVGSYVSITGTGAARQLTVCCSYNGTIVFQVTASDGHTTSPQAQFTYAIIPLPDAPLGRDDIVIATPGQPLTIDVLANDFDHDGEILSIESVTAPNVGSVEIVDDELVYTQAPGNSAPATFTYTVADSTGLTDTATVTVGIGELPSGMPLRYVGMAVNYTSIFQQVLQHDVSADGRYVAFLTRYALRPGDSNGVADVYVFDRLTSTLERVSVPTGGTLANGASERPSISADGRYVAFASAATDLVPGDTNETIDVFVRDRVAGTTVRASVGPGGVQVSGHSREPDISADGSIVVFLSTAFELVGDDANGAVDIFARDLSAGVTTRVSVRTGGGEADLGSAYPTVSGDGRIVGFASAASNLVTGDSNGRLDIFVHDRTSGVTERVSVSSTGGEANNHSEAPALSYDGRFVAFSTIATNLIPGSATSGTLVRDRQSVTTTRAFNSASENISLSGDGRYLAASFGDGSSSVRDRFAGTSHTFTSALGNEIVFPVLSRNGRYVALLSNHALDGQSHSAGTKVWLLPNPL